MTRSQNIFAAALVGAAVSLSSMAQAEQRPVVVELFTSQGCSSCPPADALLHELSKRDDVIPIALHVDYWDYIGWKDAYGHPAHADRQRAYARKAGRNTIYTPEMVVNGQTDIVGPKPMVLADAIALHKKTAPRSQLSAVRTGDSLIVQASVPTGQALPMDVHVLQVIPVEQTVITRGENRGKTYEYSSIAHNWTVAGTWDGKDPLELSVDISGDDPVIVLLQETNAGAIIAAARAD